MSLGGRLTILAVVLLAAGCDEYPRVTMINQSGEPISGIVVTLDEGYSYTVGSLDSGEETTICVEPGGESSLTLLYTNGEGERHRAVGGYLEESVGYHLTLRVREDDEVDIGSDIGY